MNTDAQRRLAARVGWIIGMAALAGASAAGAAASAPLAAGTPTSGTAGNTFYVFLPLVNTGKVAVTNVEVTSAVLGSATLATPALPIALGKMAPNASSPLYLNFHEKGLSTGHSYVLTVRGTYQSGGPAVGFTVSHSVKYGMPSVFQAPPAPLHVTPSLDSAHAATMLFPAASGGSLTATGADGTVFTLTLPANALLSDETITMTPLSSVEGLPVSGGLAAAVQLAPDGLLLQQPATLTIQPAATIPVNQQVGFGYHGSGQEFYYQPLGAAKTITLTLLHFSGAGVGQGTAGNGGTPTSVADRLMQQIQQIVSQERGCAILGTGCNPNDQNELDGLMQLYFDEVVVPLIQAAKTDDTQAQAALTAGFGFMHTLAVLGLEEGEPWATDFEFINQAVPIILKNAYNKAFNRCVNDSSQGQRSVEAQKMVSVERALQLIGGGGMPDFAKQLEACLTGPLTLDIDSTVTTTTIIPTPPGNITQKTDSHVTATGLALQFDTTALTYNANGPLEYPTYTFSAVWPSPIGDCSSASSNGTGTVQVVGEFDLNFGLAANPSQVVLHLTMTPNVSETLILGVYGPMVPCESATHQTAMYVAGLNISHGNPPTDTPEPTSYYMTIDNTAEFTDSGTYSTSTSTITATEDTKLALQQTGP